MGKKLDISLIFQYFHVFLFYNPFLSLYFQLFRTTLSFNTSVLKINSANHILRKRFRKSDDFIKNEINSVSILKKSSIKWKLFFFNFEYLIYQKAGSNPNSKKNDKFNSIHVFLRWNMESEELFKMRVKKCPCLRGTWASNSKGLINLLTKLSLAII